MYKNGLCKKHSLSNYSYNLLIWSLWLSWTTFLRSFNVAVSSPVAKERSRSKRIHFLIFCALLTAFLLYFSMAESIKVVRRGFCFASSTVEAIIPFFASSCLQDSVNRFVGCPERGLKMVFRVRRQDKTLSFKVNLS